MKKKQYSVRLAVIAYAVVVVVIVVAFFDFGVSNERRISNQTSQYILDSALNTAVMVDAEISGGIDRLSLLGSIYGTRSVSSMDISKVMTEYSEFDYVELIDKDGMTYDISGEQTQVRDSRCYIEGIRGNSGVEVAFNSQASHDTLIKLYTPVTIGGEINGVIVGVYQSGGSIREMLNVQLFNERVEAYLITPEGRVAVSSHALDPSLDINVSTLAGNDTVAADTMRIALENGTTSTFYLNGKAGCITKLSKSGLFMMQLFPETASERLIKEAFVSGLRMEIVIIAVLTLTMLAVVLYYRNSRLVIEATTDELLCYKNAVLADASIAFDADISNNVITRGAWKGASGRLVSTEELVGISLPCSYDDYIQRWAEKFVSKEYREEFLEETSRERLMQLISQGKNSTSFDYAARAVDGSNIFARRSIYLAHNSKGAVTAYCSVKDISEQHRRDEQMMQYQKMLSAIASVTYKGVRVIELENYTAKYLSFENGSIVEQDTGSWTVWLARQRGNIHADDYEEVRAALGEDALSSMKPYTNFSIDYRNTMKGDSQRLYRTTVFKTESCGRQYVYLVTIDTTDEINKAEKLTT